MTRTLTPEARARMIEGARRGGKKRAEAFTTEFQQNARANVRAESLSASGRRGYEATAARLGSEFAARFVAQWRARKSGRLVSIVRGWLDQKFICYELEKEITAGRIFVDIVTGSAWGPVVVECDESRWHGPETMAAQAQRDQAIEAAGFRVIHLTESEIKDESGLARLLKFIGG